jgi:hypothetical protein
MPEPIKARIWIAVSEDGYWWAGGWADDPNGAAAKEMLSDGIFDENRRPQPFVFQFVDVNIVPPVPQAVQSQLQQCQTAPPPSREVIELAEEPSDEFDEEDNYSEWSEPRRIERNDGFRDVDAVSDDEILTYLDCPRRTADIARSLNVDARSLHDRMLQSGMFVRRGSWWWDRTKLPLTAILPPGTTAAQWYEKLAAQVIAANGPQSATDLARQGIPQTWISTTMARLPQFAKDAHGRWSVAAQTETTTVTHKSETTVIVEKSRQHDYADGIRSWTLFELQTAIVDLLCEHGHMSIDKLARQLETTTANISAAVGNDGRLEREGNTVCRVGSAAHS